MTADARGVQQGAARPARARRRARSSSPTWTARAQRITLTRNPKWWGTPPLLDSITYLVLDDAARIPALQNNTIDATGVASLRRADHRAQHRGYLDPARARRQLVSLHVQRCAGLDTGGQGAAAGGRQGYRPAGHRQRHPARPGRQTGAAEQPHLRRRPGGLPGQQRRRRLRPREGQAGTRRAGLAAQRPVPREGRPPVGDPRCALRRATRPGRSPRSRRTASPRSASSSNSTPRAAAASSRNYIIPGDFDIAQFSLGRRRVPAVLPEPDLHDQARKATSARSAARRSTPRSSRRLTSSIPTRRARWPTNSTR